MVVLDGVGKLFYRQLSADKGHVVIVAHRDVDSLAAVYQLQCLFKCDHIPFTLHPIDRISQLVDIYNEHCSNTKYFLLINCGAGADLCEILDLDDANTSAPTFFIIDPHRPINLNTVFNEKQLFAFEWPDENLIATLPKQDDIFPDDDIHDGEAGHQSPTPSSSSGHDLFESDNSDDNEETDVPSGESQDDRSRSETANRKRRRLEDEIVERIDGRRRIAEWEKRRQQILWDYHSKHYYVGSSAQFVYLVAHNLSKASASMLWAAIVGLRSQFASGLISGHQYTAVLTGSALNAWVSYWKHRTATDASIEAVKINYENELNLPLYSHWSLWSSLGRCLAVVTKFQMWSQSGEYKLRSFLADIGIPLSEARQRYCSLPSSKRRELKDAILVDRDEKLKKWKLDGVLLSGEHCVHFGYSCRYTASDYVHSISALLDSGVSPRSAVVGDSLASEGTGRVADGDGSPFVAALRVFSPTNISALLEGIELSKKRMDLLFSIVYEAMNLNHVSSPGAYLLWMVSPGLCEKFPSIINQVPVLRCLARCLLRCYVSTANGHRRHGDKPLLLCFPVTNDVGVDVEQQRRVDRYLVIGVPPIFVENGVDGIRNILGAAFRQCAANIERSTAASDAVIFDHFDESAALVAVKYRSLFFDNLTALLSG